MSGETTGFLSEIAGGLWASARSLIHVGLHETGSTQLGAQAPGWFEPCLPFVSQAGPVRRKGDRILERRSGTLISGCPARQKATGRHFTRMMANWR
jgi:hypothetical protein